MMATTTFSLLKSSIRMGATGSCMLPHHYPQAAASAAMMFSSDCAPAMKLKSVFEEYRLANFSRELPSRFKKEIVKVIQGPDHKVAVDNFNIILANIGRHDAYLTDAELNELLQAAGGKARKIPVEMAMQLL